MGASNFGRVRECTKLWTFWLENDWEEQNEFICEDTISNVVYELKTKDFFNTSLIKWYEKDKVIWKINVDYYNTAWRYWDSNEYYIVVEFWYHEGGRFDIVPHEDGYFSEIYMNNAYSKRLKKLVKECEKVFEKYTTPIVRVGWFSDGTSLYSKV